MSDQQLDPADKRPISITKRLFLGSTVFVLLLVMFGSIHYYLLSSDARNQLALVLADLDESDPGWRLEDLEKARPTIPDAENSALIVRAAHTLVPSGWPDPKVMWRFDNLPPPPELLDAERAELLEKELAPLAVALTESRKLADMPNGRHAEVYTGYPVGFSHGRPTREIASLLHHDALNLAQQGKARESLRSCQAVLNAARSLDDEPLMIPQSVRMACVALAADRAERILALCQPQAEDLAGLQVVVEREESHPTALVGLRGERAMIHAVLNGVTDGSISPSALLDRVGGLTWIDRLVRWGIRGKARREHPTVMELMKKAIDIARLPAHEQDAAQRVLFKEVSELASHSYVIRIALGDTDPFTRRTRLKVAQMRCLMTLLAVERFRLIKKTWPAKLEELRPLLLKHLPLDPFDGRPLRYVRVGDGVIVYSVGPDGTDNGGKLDRRDPYVIGADVGYRLWDVQHRRRPPSPIPK
jgi:hypothetical protein